MIYIWVKNNCYEYYFDQTTVLMKLKHIGRRIETCETEDQFISNHEHLSQYI